MTYLLPFRTASPNAGKATLADAKQRPASLLRRLGAWRRGVVRSMAIRARRAHVRLCYPWATWRECQEVAARWHDYHEENDPMERADLWMVIRGLEQKIESLDPSRPKLRRPLPPPTPMPGPGRPISE
jgi:hypothetical protein